MIIAIGTVKDWRDANLPSVQWIVTNDIEESYKKTLRNHRSERGNRTYLALASDGTTRAIGQVLDKIVFWTGRVVNL